MPDPKLVAPPLPPMRPPITSTRRRQSPWMWWGLIAAFLASWDVIWIVGDLKLRAVPPNDVDRACLGASVRDLDECITQFLKKQKEEK